MNTDAHSLIIVYTQEVGNTECVRAITHNGSHFV